MLEPSRRQSSAQVWAAMLPYCRPSGCEAAKRDVPIPASLARMLAEHRLASRHSAETDFVFCSMAGTPHDPRNVDRSGLRPAVAAAGLPHLRWHDLRPRRGVAADR
jgi:hypothetical protein